MMKHNFISIVPILAMGLACQPNAENFLKKHEALAEKGNYWSKYELWQAYSKGQYGVTRNQSKADELIVDLTQDV